MCINMFFVVGKLVLFKALSDETRLKIIECLSDGDKCVCDLVPVTSKTQSTVSIQLGKLKKWGIVKSEKKGKFVFYGLCNSEVKKILKIVR